MARKKPVTYAFVRMDRIAMIVVASMMMSPTRFGLFAAGHKTATYCDGTGDKDSQRQEIYESQESDGSAQYSCHNGVLSTYDGERGTEFGIAHGHADSDNSGNHEGQKAAASLVGKSDRCDDKDGRGGGDARNRDADIAEHADGA